MKLNIFWIKRAGQITAVILILLGSVGCRQWIQSLMSIGKPVETAAPALAGGKNAAGLLGADGVSFKTPEISASEREYLAGVYRDTWNYMADFVEPTTGLPYDSSKKQPATAVSNIGLYLGAVAIAYRTGLIPKDEALSRINAAFTSLKKLETWRGFPRVWVAVRSLKPIHGTDTFSYSKHVANLIGGLTLVQNIFPDEMNQAVGSYIRGLGFKDMYDAGTGWVKGGYDLKLQDFAVNQPFGPWHYKFLASESRLISYYLIARGFAPASHWTSLLRTIQNAQGDWFLVSGLEDGGAYMPYMAGLYVDERDMLMGLSQRNYTHSSMKHAEAIGAPVWGWSGSLDMRGEYIPYGQLRDEIVAPYASILAVNYYPNEVISNLKTLEKMGAKPAAEVKKSGAFFGAFGDKRETLVAPYAFVNNKAVFLIDSHSLIRPLKDFLDSSTVGQVVDLPPVAELNLFFKTTGEPGYQGKSVQELVQSASRGTAVREGLAKMLNGSEALRSVLALAVKTGEFQLGEIRLKDGVLLKVIWLESSGKWIPKAISYGSNIYFLNDAGVYKKLNNLLEPTGAEQRIAGYDRDLVTYVATLTGLANELQEGGAVLTRSTRFSEEFKSISGLNPELAAELAALAAAAGDYHPAKLQFKDGEGVELALGLPGIHGAPWAKQPFMQAPWALADSKDAVFMSPSDGTIESIRGYLDQSQINQPISNLDRRTLIVFAEDLGFKPEAGKSARDYFKQAVHGTQIKSTLRQVVMDETLRQSLLGLSAKAGLYTPAKVELEDGSTALLILAQRGDVPSAVAAAKDGKIFFLGRDRQSHPLKDFENDQTVGGAFVSMEERFSLEAMAARLGYRLHQGELLADQVQTIIRGTSQKEQLAEALADAVIFPELEALAVLTDIVKPHQVQLADKTFLWVSLSDSRNPWVPYATTGGKTANVSFLSLEGVRLNLSQFLDNTLLDQKTQAYDRGALKELLVKAGVPVKGPAPVATLGTVVKSELVTQVSDARGVSELLGLAGKAGLYTPGSVEIKDVGKIHVLFTKEGEIFQPWAVANGDKIYFKNKENGIENFDSFVTKQSPNIVAAGSDPQTVAWMRGEDFMREPISMNYRATQKNQWNPEAADPLDSMIQIGELLGLAAVTGAYEPVQIQWAETKMTNYGFRDSVDWRSGKVTPYYLTPSQGMAFLSLANFLYDGVVWKTFSENTKMKNTLDQLREIDRTQNLLGDQAQRGCAIFPKS